MVIDKCSEKSKHLYSMGSDFLGFYQAEAGKALTGSVADLYAADATPHAVDMCRGQRMKLWQRRLDKFGLNNIIVSASQFIRSYRSTT